MQMHFDLELKLLFLFNWILVKVKARIWLVCLFVVQQNVPPDLSICTFVLEQSLSVRALQEMLANTEEKAEAVSLIMLSHYSTTHKSGNGDKC